MAGMGLPFLIEFLGRSWSSFIAAIGTTGLGFFASNIVQFVVMEGATHLVLWWLRGADAMRDRKKEHLLIGVVAYAIAVTTIYVPIYVRQMWKVKAEIRNEATNQPTPSFNHRVSVPSFAYELSPASITVLLSPQQGFMLDLSGPYKLNDKRQYLLILSNHGHKLQVADLEFRFPYPVEAQKVAKVNMIGKLTFTPTPPLINLLGAKLENNGCLGRWSYHLYANEVGRRGMAEISLIFNGESVRTGNGQPGDGYISGFVAYSYRGKPVRSDYYRTLEPSQNIIVKLSEPQSQPAGFRKTSGFTVLDGPCIPDSSLLAPP